ncbi:MAG: pyridoxamine 5'-phosphate oxidase [Verrucomicrobiales bacterium]|nr:pyridoxamine 5'-phosphate oxidase [Verrucomicrobiales bacterium]
MKNEKPHLAELRIDYDADRLRRADLPEHPLDLLHAWFQLALDAKIPDPHAMTLATATSDGQPSSRTVLCKGFDPDTASIEFFTNYESRKGRELAENPKAAATFLWHPLQKQVCLRGHTEKLPRENSQAYFDSRPYSSQIGALTSDQSSPLTNRDQLDARAAELTARYPEGTPVPLPDHWGGFRLIPEAWEFWQGRPSRLHDRFLYRLPHPGESPNPAGWIAERLNP